LRILHISNGDDKYGSAKCLYEILEKELKAEDITPIVLTPRVNGMNNWCDEHGIENYASDYRPWFYPVDTMGYRLKWPLRMLQYRICISKWMRDIEKQIDVNKIDIIHTNNSVTSVGYLLSKKYKKKHVWHLRECGFKHFFHKPFLKKFNYCMNESDVFVAVSKATAAEWTKLGIDKTKVVVNYDGVKVPEKLLYEKQCSSYKNSNTARLNFDERYRKANKNKSTFLDYTDKKEINFDFETGDKSCEEDIANRKVNCNINNLVKIAYVGSISISKGQLITNLNLEHKL